MSTAMASVPSTQRSNPTVALIDYLTSIVAQALSAEMHGTALFLAERLHAILPTDEAPTYFLAYALLKTHNAAGAMDVLRQPIRKRDVLHSKTANAPKNYYTQYRSSQVTKPAYQSSLRCAWVYSQACDVVGRNREGQDRLQQAIDKMGRDQVDSSEMQLPRSESAPTNAAMYLKMAQMSIKGNKADKAETYFMTALEECWWCWEAWEGLCLMGRVPDAESHFAFQRQYDPSVVNGHANHSANMTTLDASTSDGSALYTPAAGNHQDSLNASSFIGPSTNTDDSFFGPPARNARPTNGVNFPTMTSSNLFTPEPAQPSTSFAPPPAPVPIPPPRRRAPANPGKDGIRRSSRLTTGNKASSPPAATPAEKSTKAPKPRSRVASNPRERKRIKASLSPDDELSALPQPGYSVHPILPGDSPEGWLRDVMRKFGKAEACLSRFDCAGALECLMSLNVEQRRSWRACIGVGRARMEALEYTAAEKAFAAAREASPYMIVYSDLHSTLLWHLSRKTELSYLAQQIMTLQPLSNEAWIATGNVFSLFDDHANALKCFKRAIQLVESDGLRGSPVGVSKQIIGGENAYVMAGHECVALEDWESALGFYREAVRRRNRCYTAWFGIGNVYMKTGKLRLAEYHFRKAVDINPMNAMLISCVGAILERLGHRREALVEYERACRLSPQSAAVKFKKVKLLVALKQYSVAHKDLLSLAALAPDEFSVHFLLGKVYGALGQKNEMTESFTYAQDLDPRSAHRIRQAIEDLESRKEGEEMDADP